MEINQFSNELILQAKSLNISIDKSKIEKFFTYMNLLIEWNEKINLTAIVNPKEIIIKHFVDSLTIMKCIDKNTRLIDVGTGAGFPGIPIKIFDDTINVTLLDSLNKRTVFLNEVINKLDLKDITVIHGRAEDCAQDVKHREMYDYAVSRAVAPMNVLLEYLAPFVKVGGKVIAMKGSNINQEIEESKKAAQKLYCTIENQVNIALPENNGERNIVILNKNKKNEKIYPRKAGTPKKSPL